MASLQHYSWRNNITMTKLLATIIAGRPRSWPICALVLLVGLLSIGCVDQAAIDDREWERRLKFIDMMS